MIKMLLGAVLLCVSSFSVYAEASDEADFEEGALQLAKELFSGADVNKDDRVSKEEYLRFAENYRRDYRKNELRIYKSSDTDKDGVVSFAEIQNSFRDGSGKVVADVGSRIAGLMDANGDGFISEKRIC